MTGLHQNIQQHVIAANLFCVGCGYNLRGLQTEHLCPECSTPVARSLQGHLLRFANPKWLKALISGLNWILIAGAFLGLASRFFAWGTEHLGWAWIADWNNWHNAIWHHLIFIAITLMGVVGFWRVTAPEPVVSGGCVNSRWVLRWSGAAECIAYFLFIALWSTAVSSGRSVETIVTHEVVSGTVNIVQLVAVAIYGRSLALRIPDARIAQDLCIFAATMGVMTVAMKVANSACWIAASHRAPWWQAAYSTSRILDWTPCALGLWGLLILLRFRRALRLAARQSRDGWGDAAPASPQVAASV